MSEIEPLLTVRDIARMLSISTGAVRKRASRGSIPGAVIVGGGLYFHPHVIKIWTDPRESGARNRAPEMSVRITPWSETSNNEWELDIRYAHPIMVDEHGKAKRLRRKFKHVGTHGSGEKWAQAWVSAEITRLASGAVAGLPVCSGSEEAPANDPAGRGKVPTLAEFHVRHLEYMQSNGLKKRTIESHAETFRNYLGPFLGTRRIDKIGTAEIEDLKIQLGKPRPSFQRNHMRGGMPTIVTGAKALQPSTVNAVLRKLSAMLGVAKYLGAIKGPPDFRYVKEPKKDPEHYSFDDVCSIVDAAFSRIDEVSKMRNRCERTKLTALQDLMVALILLDTGIRVGELLALQPEHVDLVGKVLHIKVTVSAGELTIPKGNRARAVPLTERLLPVLRAVLAETPGPRLLMRVHKWAQTIEPWNQQAVTTSLHRTLTRAGLAREDDASMKGRGPHKCRHTCATQMIEAGVDLPTVQKILGHARITQTEKYIHLSGESMQRGSALYEARMARGRHKGDEIKIRRSSHLRAV